MAEKPFALHCALAFGVRLGLIAYSKFHDNYFNVSYTDVDYKVFTDAARHITEGNSPYDRHTYRYTPFIALLLIPNVIVFQEFGKIVFSVFDIFIGILIREILLNQKFNKKTASFCGFLWLYNPLAVVISTRGNADSLAVFFVLSVAYYLQKENCCLAGILHGFSIHLRLYPLAFSLAMYLSLRKSNSNLLPNKNQIVLVVSCVLSLLSWTLISYYFYGYKFLYESLLFHLIRKDARHNFSVYFYMLYLSADTPPDPWQKVFTFLPQLILLIGLSLYSSKRNLAFSMFTQAIVLVTYNPVMTSQYFFWFLSLLPLCLPRLKMPFSKCIVLTLAWIIAQSIWLFAAYLLEFKGFNSFFYIWLASLLFFSINIKVLIDIMNSYEPMVDIRKKNQ